MSPHHKLSLWYGPVLSQAVPGKVSSLVRQQCVEAPVFFSLTYGPAMAAGVIRAVKNDFVLLQHKNQRQR